MSKEPQLLPHSPAPLFMAALFAPVAKALIYLKVANFPDLYRHARSSRYYACKKVNGIRRERNLVTCDRKIAERRTKEWLGNLDKVDAKVEKTTLADSDFRSPRQARGLCGGRRWRTVLKTSFI